MKHTIKIIWFLIFCNCLLFISCPKSKTKGYNDLIWNSPELLWGSSINEFKNKYPNVKEFSEVNKLKDVEIVFYEAIERSLNEHAIEGRYFHFYNNRLFKVDVCYGNYNQVELDLLKNNLQKKYGIDLIENNGTIEGWHINIDKNNKIVFLINILDNNTVNCSYINPFLNDTYLKRQIDVK